MSASVIAPAGRPAPRELPSVAGLLVSSLALRVVVAGAAPLLAAEAYYWLWSRHPAAGYVDHPPGVAALIRLGTALGGHGAFGVRLGSVLAGTAAALAFFLVARAIAGPTAARRSLLLFVLAPFSLPFGLLATPDAPLLLCWVLSLLFFLGAFRRGGWARWLLAGLTTGLAILSKYNGFQLLAIFGAFLLLHPEGRRRLRQPQPWVALLLSVLMVVPNLLWDAGHGGATAATPFRQGLEVGEAVKHLGQMALLPFLLMTPLVMVAFLWAAAADLVRGRWARDDGFRLALLATGLPLLAFAGVSLLTQIHVHWMATVMVGGVPLALAPREQGQGGPGRGFQRAALVVAGCITLVLLAIVPACLALAARGQAPEAVERVAREVCGERVLARRLAAELEAHGEAPLLLTSDDYHLVSLLMWLTGGERPALPLKRRLFRQFGVWYEEGQYEGWDALFVDKGPSKDTPALLQRAFESYERLEPEPVLLEGRQLGVIELYLCRGFRGPVLAAKG